MKEVIDEKKHENDKTITSSILLPDGVDSLSGDTAQIEIKFIDPDTKLITVSSRQNENFKVIPPKDFECHIKEDSIQIKILGPSANVRRINSSGISVTVDLSSYEKGTHTDVPVDVNVISDDSAFSVGDYTISVEIY